MPTWLLNADIMTGAVPITIWVLTAVLALVLLVRDDAPRWTHRALPAVAIGGVVGLLVTGWFDAAHVVDVALPDATYWWVAAAGAAIGLAAVTLWHSPLWRRITAGGLAVCVLASATLGVNAAFGLTPTIAAMIGLNTVPTLTALPALNPAARAHEKLPLAAHWTAPADMPHGGTVGTLSGRFQIPTTGGFPARDATIYLPPAALVKNPPDLPLVVMMMGEPGAPDPATVRAVLDPLAAAHHGLAPIVIVADQLSQREVDPVCSDASVYGKVATYINDDVVGWAKTHLNVLPSPARWAIAGYSNGGACAMKWAAQFPKTWGVMISVSGDKFPGAEEQATAIEQGFGGDAAAYRAAAPAAYLARNSAEFRGHTAIFTAGALDKKYGPFSKENAALFRKAGFVTVLHEIPRATHIGPALQKGASFGFAAAYPALGLTATVRR